MAIPDAVVQEYMKYAERKCSVCNKTSDLKNCGKCKIASYCSASCQESDWKTHKKSCKDLLKFKETLKKAGPDYGLENAIALDDDIPPHAVSFLTIRHMDTRALSVTRRDDLEPCSYCHGRYRPKVEFQFPGGAKTIALSCCVCPYPPQVPSNVEDFQAGSAGLQVRTDSPEYSRVLQVLYCVKGVEDPDKVPLKGCRDGVRAFAKFPILPDQIGLELHRKGCPACGCPDLFLAENFVRARSAGGQCGVGRYYKCPMCPFQSPQALKTVRELMGPDAEPNTPPWTRNPAAYYRRLYD